MVTTGASLTLVSHLNATGTSVIDENSSLKPVEAYVDYLKLLARLQWTPLLYGKLEASDVVQQTVLQAHANRGQFRGQTEEEWLGWLRAILANVLAGSLRAYGTGARDLRRERSLDARLEESASRVEAWLIAEQSSPSQRVSRHEQLVRLAAALAKLPVDQQEAVELHHLRGHTVAEVGERMGRTRPAAMGLIYRGLKRLRELLDEESERDGERRPESGG
jgi:RNA polymerase sigma-70 factor (ECF subfamily)